MKKNRKQLFELIFLFLLTIVTFLLWNTIVIYPIKLLVVLLHEISHGIAGVMSGGEIREIQINSRLGGHCIVDGGNNILVAASGYLGSLIWGSLLFLSAYGKKWGIWFSTFLGALLIFITANYLANIFAMVTAVLFAIYFIVGPRVTNDTVYSYITKFLGITCALYAVVDIGQDVLLNTYTGSDAHYLSVVTGIPAFLWGAVWMLLSLYVIYKLFGYGFDKGMEEIDSKSLKLKKR